VRMGSGKFCPMEFEQAFRPVFAPILILAI